MLGSNEESRCIYCETPLAESGTLEHIWPQGLGGAACPDPWRSHEVCKRCNNKAGLWVDGPFLKGTLTYHEKRICNEAYIGEEVIDRAGYTYIGQEVGFPSSADEVCEFWLGPSGESCRFVHAKDDERWGTYGGGNPIERKSGDPGRIYLSLVDRGSVRAYIALASVFRSFPKARVHSLTRLSGLPTNLRDRLILDDERSAIEIEEIEWIRNTAPPELELRAVISTNFEQRFLGKLALGVGANLLSPAYLSTPYAASLRDLFHTGKGSLVRGAGYTQMKSKIAFGLEKTWTLTIWAKSELALIVTSPSGKNMSIVIAPEDSLTDDIRQQFGQGQSWVIVPIRSFCSGAIAFPDLVAHKIGNSKLRALDKLAEWQSEADDLLGSEQIESVSDDQP